MGKYSALWFCIVPPFGRANNTTLELNISPYCPPGRAIIYINHTVYCPTIQSKSVLKWHQVLQESTRRLRI